ncbi:TetR/AcrR family transcriptional regulator [Longimicrobium sp.]|uniref:TetR/AcrR family transcriptional regulator n=1 Tax=Longimicrobium sp. TaxID=2029185 RepID=UPI002E33DA73|nr:TetR/AcrR family transcriptional regulator [Longimicrobium sp.]HEX6037188.1 TetR/AcrR family transcriptional regulator [Longimicrobium sp.]
MAAEADGSTAGGRPSAVRDRILATASDLFYRHGVHAVGVDLVVKESGIAKTSLYRHFGNKDTLIAAFLQEEDADFWRQWDAVADEHRDDPAAELEAHLAWIQARLRRPGYRGCPQLNVAAEFPAPDHPARQVAAAHKEEMRRRLSDIAGRMGLPEPKDVGAQLALALDGAFMSAPLGGGDQIAATLASTVHALLTAPRAQAESS